MPSPRIEIGCIGLNILVTIREAMRVEHKLVGGEEYTTVMAFDTFGSRRIVTCGNELPTATPTHNTPNDKTKENNNIKTL